MFHWIELLLSSSACTETVALAASFLTSFLAAAISFLCLLHLLSLNSSGIKGKRKILTETSNYTSQHKAKAETHLSFPSLKSAQIMGSLFHGLHISTMSSREMHRNSWKPLTKTLI